MQHKEMSILRGGGLFLTRRKCLCKTHCVDDRVVARRLLTVSSEKESPSSLFRQYLKGYYVFKYLLLFIT